MKTAMYPFFQPDFRPLPRPYRSNWRNLQVDGFEERPLQFFAYVRPEHYKLTTTAAPRPRTCRVVCEEGTAW